MTLLGIHEGHNASVCVLKEKNDHIELFSFEAERIDRIKYSVWCDRYTGDTFSNVEKRKWIVEHTKELSELIQHSLIESDTSIEDIDDIICTQGTDCNRLPDWIVEKGYSEASHHLSHAASSYYSSDFAEALIIVCDGVGDAFDDGWEVQSVWRGIDENIYHLFSTRKKNRFDMGIGNTYQLITYFLNYGFGGCGTTMALASFGKPDADFKDTIFVKECNGDVLLNKKLIDPASYLESISFVKGKHPIFDLEYEKALREVPTPDFFSKRESNENPLNEKFTCLAATIQSATEEAVSHIIEVHKQEKDVNLCLSGGVFLNCQMNSKLRERFNFKGFHIPTAPGDGGLAVGAVLFMYYSIYHGKLHWKYTPYIGTLIREPRFLPTDISIKETNNLFDTVTDLIIDGKLVAWCNERAESGPRALGNRSLLASPIIPEMPDRINERIKHREAFRPFAPAVLEEEYSKWFDGVRPLDYMLEIRYIKEDKRCIVPGIVHSDGSARVQIVSQNNNPHFHNLLAAFNQKTSVPILINTSLNRRGEPIVDSADDAIKLLRMGLVDALVINNRLYIKNEN